MARSRRLTSPAGRTARDDAGSGITVRRLALSLVGRSEPPDRPSDQEERRLLAVADPACSLVARRPTRDQEEGSMAAMTETDDLGDFDEPPTCPICDGIHGYLCPIESPDPGYYADEMAAGR